jgi:tetratricopeptide (TPR) repeat protein
VLKELSRAHEAHAAYLRALLVAPTMGEIYNNLAVLATGELRLPELALRHIQDGRRLAPSALDWDTPHGLALSQLGRHSEAAAALAAAARAAPSSEGAACQLAIARMRIADWRDVDELMHRARAAIERSA